MNIDVIDELQMFFPTKDVVIQSESSWVWNGGGLFQPVNNEPQTAEDIFKVNASNDF